MQHQQLLLFLETNKSKNFLFGTKYFNCLRGKLIGDVQVLIDFFKQFAIQKFPIVKQLGDFICSYSL